MPQVQDRFAWLLPGMSLSTLHKLITWSSDRGENSDIAVKGAMVVSDMLAGGGDNGTLGNITKPTIGAATVGKHGK
jgi:hypothetical protein